MDINNTDDFLDFINEQRNKGNKDSEETLLKIPKKLYLPNFGYNVN